MGGASVVVMGTQKEESLLGKSRESRSLYARQAPCTPYPGGMGVCVTCARSVRLIAHPLTPPIDAACSHILSIMSTWINRNHLILLAVGQRWITLTTETTRAGSYCDLHPWNVHEHGQARWRLADRFEVVIVRDASAQHRLVAMQLALLFSRSAQKAP